MNVAAFTSTANADAALAITYRQVMPEEVDAFLAVRMQGLEEMPRAFVDSPDELRARPREAAVRRLREDFMAGAFDGDKLVGIAGYFIHKPKKFSHRGYVHGVYVVPEYRGKKDASGNSIGEQMLRFLIDHARNHVEHLELGVAQHSPRVQALYERVGFVAYGPMPKIMKMDDGSYVTDNYMWMDLTE